MSDFQVYRQHLMMMLAAVFEMHLLSVSQNLLKPHSSAGLFLTICQSKSAKSLSQHETTHCSTSSDGRQKSLKDFQGPLEISWSREWSWIKGCVLALGQPRTSLSDLVCLAWNGKYPPPAWKSARGRGKKKKKWMDSLTYAWGPVLCACYSEREREEDTRLASRRGEALLPVVFWVPPCLITLRTLRKPGARDGLLTTRVSWSHVQVRIKRKKTYSWLERKWSQFVGPLRFT